MRGKKIQKTPKRGKPKKDVHSSSEHEDEQAKTPQVNEPKVVTKTASKQKASKENAAENKGNATEQNKVEVLSNAFYKQIDDFQNFNSEYLKLKFPKGDEDMSNAFSSSNDEVRQKIEQSCAATLKEETKEILKWIDREKQNIREKITKAENCEVNNRKSLQDLSLFTKDQIEDNVGIIQKKKAELEKGFSEYQALQSRGGEMFKS